MSAESSIKGRVLLVLAASVQQVPVIRRCIELGARVITLDNRPDNPGHALAHRSYNVDIRDLQAVFDIAVKEKIDGVIAAASDVAVETAAEIGARLGVIAPPVFATRALLSKLAFRETQQAMGLPTPQWSSDGSSPATGPWIVKPARASGSRGIRIVRDKAELSRVQGIAQAASLDGAAIVEAVLDGSQHTVEGWMQDGKIAAVMITDRLTAEAPLVATVGHRTPTHVSPAAQAEICRDLSRLFQHLGYSTGPFDADVVMTRDGPVLLEASTRTGGNGLMQLVSAATGADVTQLLILHALNLLPALGAWNVGCAGVHVLGDPSGGRLVYKQDAMPALRAEPWLVELSLDLPSGSQVPAFTEGRDRYGHVVVTAKSPAELDGRLAEVLARLELAVE